MNNFAAMNEVYEKACARVLQILILILIMQLLPNPKPARTCIQAAKLPNDVDVEIEAIAAS